LLAPSDTLLSVDGLTVRFDASRPWLTRLLTTSPRRTVHAVEDVSFKIERGRTFALVGESGCGKSTIARTIVGIEKPTVGAIAFRGALIGGAGSRRIAMAHKRDMQMVFQDPYASLNPRWRAGRIVAEPLVTHGIVPDRAAIQARVAELLGLVGLSASDARKYPHQFSGGQRQRISIARALASDPAFIVCDEPTSALDVSVQAQILNLMRSLQRRLGLTYLLISHNLAVVAHMADMLGIMYLGRLVEQGDAAQILTAPRHPYTRMLLDLAPDLARPNRQRAPLAGEVPSPIAPPPGCGFHPRCPFAAERCRTERPLALRYGRAEVACHAVEEGRLPAVAANTRPVTGSTP
jgi:peptide/nickel transport system ATP-binding protein